MNKIPKRYIPSILSKPLRETYGYRYALRRLKRDTIRQRQAIIRSRKAYKRGVYINRPKIASFANKKSPHVYRATNLYGVPTMAPTPTLARATGCSRSALNQIIKKGEGAFYSSGSRPNQTAQSWAYARLGSSLTGGPASQVDYKILEKGCSKKSRPLQLANRTRRALR
jgi:hypothetical protein